MLIFSRQNRFKCFNLHDLVYIFLDNGVMTTPKRRILSFVFTVLCFKKQFLWHYLGSQFREQPCLHIMSSMLSHCTITFIIVHVTNDYVPETSSITLTKIAIKLCQSKISHV